MASSNKRERDLARAKAQRQEARRTAQRRRRVRASAITAGAVVLAVVAGVAGVSALTGDDSPDTLAAEPTPDASDGADASASPAATDDCTYREEGEPSRPVELPPTGDEVVRTGTATITMTTARGDVVVQADAAAAPCTVNALASLAEQDFYSDTSCHRLTTSGIFVLQCGDPEGEGFGGPGYRYEEENLPTDYAAAPGGGGAVLYPAGTLAMAKSAVPGSTGSQFFLVYEDSPLTPDYTVVGPITQGLDLVQQVADAGVLGDAGDGAPVDPLVLEDVTVAYG